MRLLFTQKLNTMKRITAIIFLAIFSIPVIRAQESMFTIDDQVLNVGIGIGSVYAFGSYYTTTVPPLSISFEKAVVDDILEEGVIGVGAYAGFTSYRWTYFTADYGYKYSNIILGARGNFHYPLVDKLDTYVGVLLGYNISISSTWGPWGGDTSPDSGGIAFAGYLGGRYYFSDQFSAFAELGYGISYLTLGVGIKL